MPTYELGKLKNDLMARFKKYLDDSSHIIFGNAMKFNARLNGMELQKMDSLKQKISIIRDIKFETHVRK